MPSSQSVSKFFESIKFQDATHQVHLSVESTIFARCDRYKNWILPDGDKGGAALLIPPGLLLATVEALTLAAAMAIDSFEGSLGDGKDCVWLLLPRRGRSTGSVHTQIHQLFIHRVFKVVHTIHLLFSYFLFNFIKQSNNFQSSR